MKFLRLALQNPRRHEDFANLIAVMVLRSAAPTLRALFATVMK
jgi:hypothetical protein